MCRSQTHRDTFVLGAEADVVPLPGDVGLRVSTRGNALQHGGFPSRHHHVTGGLPEVIPQDWGKDREARGTRRM